MPTSQQQQHAVLFKPLVQQPAEVTTPQGSRGKRVQAKRTGARKPLLADGEEVLNGARSSSHARRKAREEEEETGPTRFSNARSAVVSHTRRQGRRNATRDVNLPITTTLPPPATHVITALPPR